MTEKEAPPAGTEIFRYSSGDEVRIYKLRVVAGGTELWRVTQKPGHPDAWIKEDDFKDSDVAAQYLQEVERALMAGGWRHVSEFQLPPADR